jgi:diaminopimelate decarboxylase
MHLEANDAQKLVKAHGSPLFVYSNDALKQRAEELLALKLPYGLTVRYAMKANPHPQILKLFADKDLHYDASSSYEAMQLLELGVSGDRVSLSGQQPPHNLPQLLRAGVRFVATSMHQLAMFAEASEPGARVALRVNAGVGSGHVYRNVTAGVGASFGLWHEYVEKALDFAKQHDLVIDRLQTHIGSGVDPSTWGKAIDVALQIAARMPEVTTLNMGGGYKVHRYAEEQEANMGDITATFAQKLTAFAAKTGRKLHLEIEPGTWLVAHAGQLLAEIVDVVDTGPEGFSFLRTNTGMNDFIRPSIFGSQHVIRVLNAASEQAEYIVVGHCCESSDILTPAPGDPETIRPRQLNKAKIGDLLVIEDTGAYCAGWSTKGYNGFPDALEIFV